MPDRHPTGMTFGAFDDAMYAVRPTGVNIFVERVDVLGFTPSTHTLYVELESTQPLARSMGARLSWMGAMTAHVASAEARRRSSATIKDEFRIWAQDHTSRQVKVVPDNRLEDMLFRSGSTWYSTSEYMLVDDHPRLIDDVYEHLTDEPTLAAQHARDQVVRHVWRGLRTSQDRADHMLRDARRHRDTPTWAMWTTCANDYLVRDAHTATALADRYASDDDLAALERAVALVCTDVWQGVEELGTARAVVDAALSKCGVADLDEQWAALAASPRWGQDVVEMRARLRCDVAYTTVGTALSDGVSRPPETDDNRPDSAPTG